MLYVLNFLYIYYPLVGLISAQENVTDICETEQDVLSLACLDLGKKIVIYIV